MLDAAKAAEALIVAAKSGADGSEAPDASTPAEGGTPENVEDHLAALDGSASPAPSTLSLPASSSAEVDISTLTPQTFLVRPTRPDANRNRGKNAFKRKPKPKPSAAAADAAASGAAESTSAQMQTAQRVPSIRNVEVEEDEGSDEDPFDEDIVQEMEHLQLALEEAWFLATAIGALKVYDPTSVSCHSCLTASSYVALASTALANDTGHLHSAIRSPLSSPHTIPNRGSRLFSAPQTPARRPLPGLLRIVPPLPLARLGCQARHQVLVRLAPLSQGARLFALCLCMRRHPRLRGPRGARE